MLSISEKYHVWYYEQEIWRKTKFLGVPLAKSVSDLWNYQEILSEIKPSIIVELGTHVGGSTLFFAEMLKLISPRGRVLSVDIDQSPVFDRVRENGWIELLESDTRAIVVAGRVRQLRAEYPGNAFFILDSAHTKDHVFGELLQLRTITQPGDYVIVEDGNINGNPVLPGWGEGPFEAVQQYLSDYPNDYRVDTDREQKFGFTFAPGGFLVRV
jgi:cephalosporin hydroxylase